MLRSNKPGILVDFVHKRKNQSHLVILTYYFSVP